MAEVLFFNKPLKINDTPYGTLQGSILTGYIGFMGYLNVGNFLRGIKGRLQKHKPKLKEYLEKQITKYEEFLGSNSGKKLNQKQAEAVRNTISLLEQMLNAV